MKRNVLIAGSLLALLAASTPSDGQTISNYGRCPYDIMREFEALNESMDKLREAGIRTARISGVSCLTGSWGSYVWKAHIRAADGRQLEWKPEDGANDLKRMLLLGR